MDHPIALLANVILGLEWFPGTSTLFVAEEEFCKMDTKDRYYKAFYKRNLLSYHKKRECLLRPFTSTLVLYWPETLELTRVESPSGLKSNSYAPRLAHKD